MTEQQALRDFMRSEIYLVAMLCETGTNHQSSGSLYDKHLSMEPTDYDRHTIAAFYMTSKVTAESLMCCTIRSKGGGAYLVLRDGVAVARFQWPRATCLTLVEFLLHLAV